MGFLQDFALHNEGNEIPKRFVIWGAYGALSGIIGRRVHLYVPHIGDLVPNIYALLVSKAGGRKSSCLDKVIDLLHTAAPTLTFSGDNDTYQGIITAMQRPESQIYYNDDRGQRVYYRPYCILASEFPDYIQNNPLGMVAFLTNIYDRRHYLYRLKNEDQVLEWPYVMMLACTTTPWLVQQVKSEQFQAGYGRRTILVCNETYDRKKPYLDQVHKDAWQRCIRRLKDLTNFHGAMTLTPDADKWFWEWYTKGQGKSPDDSYMLAWRESWHINLLKIAILISLSERDDLVITTEFLQLALSQLVDIEENMPMVTSMVGRSELVGPSKMVLTVLKSAGGVMSEKELKLRTFKEFKDAREQWTTIEFLKSTEQIFSVAKDGKPHLALPDRVKIVPQPPQSPTDSSNGVKA